MMTPIDREKYMSIEEVKQLRTVTEAWAITDLRYGRVQGIISWMVVDLALRTGLRVGEIEKLEIKDVDLKRGALRITRLKKKGQKPETLAIGKELKSHLAEYIEWTERKSGPLFVGKRGALGRQGLQKIWKKAIQKAGLPEELSIHSARHTAATQALKKTQNLRFVQKMLGHSSPATTANMYADISFEDIQDGLTGLYE